MNPESEPTTTPVTDEDRSEIKSIEINLNVIKNFFTNAISLYERLIKIKCKSCNILSSEEFVKMHRNLLEFEDIFKVFDVAFNKTLVKSIVKIDDRPEPPEDVEPPEEHYAERCSMDGSAGRNCYVNSKQFPNVRYCCYVGGCNQFYSSEEGCKIHFIKNHCKKGDIFEMIPECDTETLIIDVNDLKKEKNGKYRCKIADCTYSTADRSNFKVHLKRHKNSPRFVCVCGKKFFTKDPLMIHFVRVHMKDIDWRLALTDVRTLRKTIRKCINREYFQLASINDIPDSDSDLTGPIDEESSELNDYITQAMAAGEGDETNAENEQKKDDEDEQNKNAEKPPVNDEREPALNSFNVSLNLRDNSFFIDSVTFRTEGVEDEIDDLMKRDPGEISKKKTRLAISETKDKVIKTNIPQRHRKYKCPHKFCQQEFFTTKNLLVHLKASHDPSNPIVCTEPGCLSRFKSKALLAQHQRRHQVQYTCSLCPYKTHLAALMTRHNRQHAGESLYHECSICSEKFEYLGALKTHLTKVHNEVEPLKCEWLECNKRFKTIVGLKKHTREFHYNMKPEHHCDWPDCGSTFSNRSSLINHTRIHTNERPFQCTWPNCGKYFRLNETLKRHIKLHQGLKPFACPFDNCTYAFITKRSQKRHIQRVHLQNSCDPDQINSDESENENAAGHHHEDEEMDDDDDDDDDDDAVVGGNKTDQADNECETSVENIKQEFNED